MNLELSLCKIATGNNNVFRNFNLNLFKKILFTCLFRIVENLQVIYFYSLSHV